MRPSSTVGTVPRVVDAKMREGTMPAYRLLSTRHHPDGSMDTPSTVELAARDDRDADEQARRYPLEDFIEGADYAWLVDEAGAVVSAFPVAEGRACFNL